ncbi:MAG: hypothetical protein QXJ74_04640 [Nitrososphaera sp.]
MSDDQPKESVFGIMDDLLSHLNRTKKLFMALVISSFIVAPLAIILSILIFMPPFLTGVGQQQDVVISAKAGVIQGFPNDTMAPGTAASGWVRIVPSEDAEKFNFTITRPIEGGDTIFVERSQLHVEYVPAGETRTITVFEAQPMPPRFLYVGAQPAAPFDVTWIMVAVIGVSAAMAGAWLFIGVKEYRFFAHWNRRYSNYKEMQDKVDRELEGSGQT